MLFMKNMLVAYCPRADEVAEFPELVRFEFSVKEKRILCLLV